VFMSGMANTWFRNKLKSFTPEPARLSLPAKPRRVFWSQFFRARRVLPERAIFFSATLVYNVRLSASCNTGLRVRRSRGFVPGTCCVAGSNNINRSPTNKHPNTPMKIISRSILPALSLCALTLGIATAQAQTSGYTQYSSSYTVQNRTSGCGGFSNLGGGEYKMWVCAGEERVEMRWANWPQQTHYNQFQANCMFSSDTQNTAIHQIKSNTGGEPIYIQVQSPGTLRNDNGSVFMSGMANTWFRINSLFNPANGDARAYINGSQKVSRSYPTSDRQWYFKNGVYNNGLPSGHKSTDYYKNITFWVK